MTITYSPPQPAGTTAVQGPEEDFVTTITETPPQQQQPTKNVTLSPLTTIQTVTLPGGSIITQTVRTSELVTVTAAPGIQTVSVTQTTDHYQTVTQTV